MKKYSAHYVFPLVSDPLKNGIVVIDDNGFFHELIDTEGQVNEVDRLEFHSGILIPEIPGLTINELRKFQKQMPHLSLNEILKQFSSRIHPRFVPGEKASLYLIFPLDLISLKLTEKSRLKKLV